jgi:hypothetical protein
MNSLNIKRVCIKNPSVKTYLNKHLLEQESYPEVVYIGRKIKAKGYPDLPGSSLANPYYINKDGTREEVVEKYRKWLWEQIQGNTEAKEELEELLKNIKFKQKLNAFPLKIACWCKEDEKCHGDVVINCLNWMNENNLGDRDVELY